MVWAQIFDGVLDEVGIVVCDARAGALDSAGIGDRQIHFENQSLAVRTLSGSVMLSAAMAHAVPMRNADIAQKRLKHENMFNFLTPAD